MAVFNKNKFKENDDYFTPKYAWEDIIKYIPKNKIIWEAFYNNDSKSGSYLKEMGFDVLYNDDDFFKTNKGDILISNPPFSKTKLILKRLVEINKPFILIMPVSRIASQYVRKMFMKLETPLQIIIPKKRIHFLKMVDNKLTKTGNCNFDCFYYCYKIGLPKDVIWLND